MNKLIAILSLIVAFASCADKTTETKTGEVVTISSPAADSSAEPYLFTDAKGIVHLSWVQKKGESSLRFSTLVNDQWTAPVTISSGNNWFVNWADYPVVSSDAAGNMLAHFLEKSDTATFTYDIKLVASADAGKTWGKPTTLHDDGKKAEHGFVSITPYNDQFIAAWLDGRKTGMEGNDHSKHEGHHGEMTLRAALLDKKGTKTNEWELDGRICDCCQTTIAITENGPIIVYRDRSDDEIRDMSIVRFVNGEWTQPKTIFPDEWKIAGCPVNGPRADAVGNNVAIAWFSMKENKAQVKIIFSEDGGATFNPPIQIDEGKAIGRVDVVMLDKQSAMVSWMEGSAIKALKVNADGTKGKAIIIAESSDSRTSGFPQMTKAGNQLIFAWTDSKEKTIKLASLQL